jgi:hypothetical protein
VRADVDARVAGVAGEVVSEETFREGAGSVAELADGVGVGEVRVREQRFDRAVLVDGLQVLDAADPVVDAAGLRSRQVPRRSRDGEGIGFGLDPSPRRAFSTEVSAGRAGATLPWSCGCGRAGVDCDAELLHQPEVVSVVPDLGDFAVVVEAEDVDA